MEVLNHVDNLSSTLQHKSMSAADGQVLAKMTIETLKTLCNGNVSICFGCVQKRKVNFCKLMNLDYLVNASCQEDMMMVCLTVTFITPVFRIASRSIFNLLF